MIAPMITDADVVKLKKTFATKEDFGHLRREFGTVKKDLGKLNGETVTIKDGLGDLRLEVGELKDEVGEIHGTINRIEVTLDKMAGAIQDLRTENGAGAAHLARHDRQIAALAALGGTKLPD
jgi:predicted nuclease with TOPRIM domain